MLEETTEVLAVSLCKPLTSTFVVGTAGLEPATSASRKVSGRFSAYRYGRITRSEHMGGLAWTPLIVGGCSMKVVTLFCVTHHQRLTLACTGNN